MTSLFSRLCAFLDTPDEPVDNNKPLAPNKPVSSQATITPLLGHPKLNNAAYWKDGNDPEPRLVIFSGAGLSHESGLSLFRGQDGLWENHSVEEVCNANTWRLFRDKVEPFYEKRWADSRAAEPNAGHVWCAEQAKRGAVLLTQNVDDLLERAGAPLVGHLHGRLDHRCCFACDFRWQREPTSQLEDEQPCPACQSEDTRVDVVFFHEQAQAYETARRVLGGLRAQDVLMIVGTSIEVYNPIHSLTTNCQVWVVDPNPPAKLLDYPRVKVFNSPASELGGKPAMIWEVYRQANSAADR